MRGTTLRAVLRTIAIVIALTAAVDPTITARRTPKPDVAVIATDPRSDGALADRVARALGDRYTVFRAPLPSAAATVVVGDRIPAASSGVATPAFAVLPDRGTLRLTLENVDAPARAPAEARVPVRVRAYVAGARGRTIDVSLRDAGVMADHVTRTVASNDESVDATLTYVPAGVGAAALRVVATLSGTTDSAAADVVVDVRDARWSVLFFDARPSWQSTFVRRAIERDPRFVVTSRVVTSRNVSVDAGEPPSRLDDRAMLAAHDVIVIGAPEALSVADVVGLEAYLRRRGGSVVLLPDRRAAGPVDRLTAAAAWIVDSIPKATPIRASDGSALLATELTWPLPAPVNSEPLARLPDSLRGRMSARPIVWKTYVGAGRVIVNGALDSWRFRDRPNPSFDAFWQTLISTVAAEAVPAIDAKVSSPVARPGERVRLFVTMRDAALSTLPARATVSATLDSTDIRLWPGGAAGELEGSFEAPSSPGSYRVELSAGAEHVSVPLVVRADASHPAGPAESDVLAAWAVSRGGRAIAASNLDSVVAAVSSAVHPASRVQPWSPMREWWWIVPFALALSAEWWLRRRNGLA